MQPQEVVVRLHAIMSKYAHTIECVKHDKLSNRDIITHYLLSVLIYILHLYEINFFPCKRCGEISLKLPAISFL